MFNRFLVDDEATKKPMREVNPLDVLVCHAGSYLLRIKKEMKIITSLILGGISCV